MQCNLLPFSHSLPRVTEGQLDLRRHREALQTLQRHASLIFVLIVNESDISSWDQAHLLEARVLPEEHRQHSISSLVRQILDKKGAVGLRNTLSLRRRLGSVRRLLRIPTDAILNALLRNLRHCSRSRHRSRCWCCRGRHRNRRLHWCPYHFLRYSSNRRSRSSLALT